MTQALLENPPRILAVLQRRYYLVTGSKKFVRKKDYCLK